MTSYDHNENFGLYLAVLKKSEPSPLLPESDEDRGVNFAPARRAPALARGGRRSRQARWTSSDASGEQRRRR